MLLCDKSYQCLRTQEAVLVKHTLSVLLCINMPWARKLTRKNINLSSPEVTV